MNSLTESQQQQQQHKTTNTKQQQQQQMLESSVVQIMQEESEEKPPALLKLLKHDGMSQAVHVGEKDTSVCLYVGVTKESWGLTHSLWWDQIDQQLVFRWSC